ncbi:MAG: phosphatidylglycerophosphatase A [Acidobacteriaceae bacterium]|nr:phosphatidylglycerophosphatase A [Acidobacteriaceae bacterium]
MEQRHIERTPWAWTLATFLGIGNLKPGPGTYGSVAAMLIWLCAAQTFHLHTLPLALYTVAATVLITLGGIPASTLVAQEAGREDPGFVVVDEVAGQWLTLVALSPSWRHALLGLALFRLFDIWKPWPVRRFEELHGGTGIMLDDLAAGVLGLIAAQLLTHFVPVLR